ncbi:glycosyltransferase family 1 protein [Ancylomarina euxinus]|uniref:Glycosyltransferase family 1 protein n=1 Tax=Ancylomarina euxinus TaxID=2283627 RepID=A0A425Y6J9_9BACT|nr:glycosyltransferase [Ancylomarina euxinus]MCZ4694005.1 glycosyltransferase [Ancylomarina euxinus]MUP14575.1 glycosyltransferase [Ancylomarina euxinus]RRG24124.1 glycosyltransferase family 1 protein [Ancylomarina euxinus]
MKKCKLVYIGNQLSKYGLTPTLVETLGERLKNDFEVVQGSNKQNKIFRLLHMWWLVILNRKSDYLLIDTYSTSSFLYAWSSAVLSRLFHLKYVPILHGGNLPLRAKRSPKLMKQFLSKAYEVVCPSDYLKVEMEKAVGGNYLVIPNFIDLVNYSFEVKSIEEEKEMNLLWVRSFHEIYNPYLAIIVLRQLHNNGFDKAKLCMVGPDKDGSLKKTKQMVTDYGLNDFVSFTGKVSQKEWIALSKGYNIFLNTTNIDNTPVSVMEAMALGFPVISTKVGGIPYLFRDKEEGIMVEPNNSEAIVSAIKSLENHPENVNKISKAARNKACEWDWNLVRNQWLSLLSN